jgi:lipopolysaccharide transport system ATP-binding protein
MGRDVVIRTEGLGKKYLIGDATELGVSRHANPRRARSLAQGKAGNLVMSLSNRRSGDRISLRRASTRPKITLNNAGIWGMSVKILSRITEPSEGSVTIDGRVASLLEVGTGFHPELTGRENIYLNGAILGMTRVEIGRKFDEIVAFAEAAKFLDTPVKRYSSGMYVRLAFAVAAHLEPEILVVDEVLAVGDAEFQKKCLGKMSNVASGGRTVLFVSHNLNAIESLCRSCIGLQGGRIFTRGATANVLDEYIGSRRTVKREVDLSLVTGREGAGPLRFARISLADGHGDLIDRPRPGQTLEICLRFSGSNPTRKAVRVGVTFATSHGVTLFVCDTESAHKKTMRICRNDILRVKIPEYY